MPVSINGTTGLITAGASSSGGGGVATNTALGGNALQANTSGTNNTALGNEALQANTTANYNTAVGYQAGYSTTTGARNAFGGYVSGYSNTTGTRNTGFGPYSLYSNTTGNFNTAVGDIALYTTTGSYNTAIGIGAGELITTGAQNTFVGTYNGNQNDLDLRTSSNNIVLSDGNGNARIYNSNNGVTRLFTAYQNTLTNNTKGGTVTILPRDVFFPPSYFNAINTCTIIVNCVASEGTSGGYNRTDILHVNNRFGYAIASLASNANDGISASNWTYSFDSNGLRVTQNWGASGPSLGTRWSFFIAGCLFQG